MTTQVDTVIRSGRVIDPGNNIDSVLDVAVKDGRIFMVSSEMKVHAKQEFDASGCIITPGLIDAHVHCYQYATPLGVDPDETCLARGVTTVIDAGSAGSFFLVIFDIYLSTTRVSMQYHP